VLCLAGVGLGLFLVAFQMLPTIEMAGRSSRAEGGLEAAGASAYALEPANLPNLAAPRRLADAGEQSYFRAFPGGRVPWLISIYLGTVVLYLALRGLLTAGGCAGPRFMLAVFAVTGLLLALGENMPLTGVLYRHLPGTGWFRYPEKFLFLPAVSVPLLAALGCATAGRQSPDSGNRWWAEAAALLVPLGLLIMPLTIGERLGAYSTTVPAILLILAAVVHLLGRRGRLGGGTAMLLLAVLAAADLSAAHRLLNATVPVDFYREPPAVARVILGQERDGPHPPRLCSTLPGRPGGPPVTERGRTTPLETHLVWRAYLTPNSAGSHGISQIRGSTGMELARPAHRERLLARAPLEAQLALLSLWGVEYLLMDRELDAPGDLQLLSDRLDLYGQSLYWMRRALPRAFLADPALVDRYPEAEARLQSGESGMAALVDDLRTGIETAGRSGDDARFTSWAAGRFEAEVTTGAAGTVLVVTESHDPGWQALVDGRPAAVREGLGGFILVDMPSAGRHTLVLRYRPPWFRTGLVLSLLTVSGLLVCCIAVRRRHPSPVQATVDRAGGKP